MRVMRQAMFVLVVVVLFAVAGVWANGRSADEPQTRIIHMTARQYAFEPSTIRANLGDTLVFRLQSADVMHGFYLEGHDVEAVITPQSPYVELRRPSEPDARPQKVEEIVVTADRTGKFRYRCSHTCGTMHPFMMGELVVAPNRLFIASSWGIVGLTAGLAGTALSSRKKQNGA